jgi:hypothetical protein
MFLQIQSKENKQKLASILNVIIRKIYVFNEYPTGSMLM